jgi:hypothetical protein
MPFDRETRIDVQLVIQQLYENWPPKIAAMERFDSRLMIRVVDALSSSSHC